MDFSTYNLFRCISQLALMLLKSHSQTQTPYIHTGTPAQRQVIAKLTNVCFNTRYERAKNKDKRK